MKASKVILAAVGMMLLMFAVAWAVDYSTMTTEELSGIRGTMRDKSPEERDAFRDEWQKRVKDMSPEDRQKYTGRPDNAPADGQGMGQGKGQGKGDGSGNGRGMGSGAGQGGMGGGRRK